MDSKQDTRSLPEKPSVVTQSTPERAVPPVVKPGTGRKPLVGTETQAPSVHSVRKLPSKVNELKSDLENPKKKLFTDDDSVSEGSASKVFGDGQSSSSK